MTAIGLVRFHSDPLADSAYTRARGRWVASVVVAAVLHAALGAALPHARVEQPSQSDTMLEVVEVAPSEPPPPVAESEPEPKPERAAAAPREAERRAPTRAPAPAEAGQVVTRETDPNEP